MNDCISTCIIARLEPENAVLYALIVSCRYEHGNEDVRMLHGEGACEVEETRDESGGVASSPTSTPRSASRLPVEAYTSLPPSRNTTPAR